LYFHHQDHVINSEDMVAFLEHLLRGVPGHMVLIWDGAPIIATTRFKSFAPTVRPSGCI
jgi:hypothetical protein